MGLCAASGEEKIRNNALDRELRKDNRKQEEIHKLLLLGAGQSGKSTVFKQMISLYGEGFPEAERKSYKTIINGNVVASMQVLIAQADLRAIEQKNAQYAISDDLAQHKDIVMSAKPNKGEMSTEIAESIAKLWKDKGIREIFEVRSEYQLNDSANYYFDRISDIGQVGYLPTEADVMRSRARTTGVIENTFIIEGNQFRMFDVGGQRSERKKWIHCFEGVSAVLYVVAISSYDQLLFEDGETNRIVEALELFDEICNSRWFARASMILFLNKRDLFAEKIKKKAITVSPALAGYEGDNSYADTTEYIIEVFDDRNKTDKRIYPHLTCATDRDNVQKVFDSVKDTVMHKGLVDAGLTTVG